MQQYGTPTDTKPEKTWKGRASGHQRLHTLRSTPYRTTRKEPEWRQHHRTFIEAWKQGVEGIESNKEEWTLALGYREIEKTGGDKGVHLANLYRG